MATTFNDPVNVNGRLTFGSGASLVNLPAASVGDTQASSASPLGVTKTTHRLTPTLAQVHGTAATTERRAVHVAHAAGTIAAFRAGVVVANVGAATIEVDLRKNGTTTLTAPISLDNGDAAYAEVDGSVSVTSYVAGDVLEVVVTATAGGGTLGQGLYCHAVLNEAAGS